MLDFILKTPNEFMKKSDSLDIVKTLGYVSYKIEAISLSSET